MRKENIGVIIWGLGSIGKGIAELLISKKGVDIVGAVARGEKIGKSMYKYLGLDNVKREDIVIGSYEDVITERSADVVLICTDSFTKGVFDKCKFVLEKKINVITTAEEMAYPQAQEPKLAKDLDTIAKENDVTLLGTGINPGLIMDLLVIALTGACYEVNHIEAKRINNLSPFGPAVMREQGVGLTLDEFKNKNNSGELSGHVGFPESINMISDALGWKLSDVIKQTKTPIISKNYRKSPNAEVQPGNVAGVNMLGYGYVDNELKIEMIHPQQVEPQSENIETGDYINISGTPNISMSIKPEIPGGIGTIAMCVNMIPHVINSRPGLKTMLDLPVPRAIMGDMRAMI